MPVGAAGADFVGASNRGDQGGVPVSGWRRRSVPDARRSGVWGRPERASLRRLPSGLGRPPLVKGRPCSATILLTAGLVLVWGWM
jgi:hypothetical protein